MKIAIFDAKDYDREYFDRENKGRHKITYFAENLSEKNIGLTSGFDAACGFVNTHVDHKIIEGLAAKGVKVWLQRSMGYNAVDLKAAEEKGIRVFRVPNYSAESVSEHAVALLMAVNRHLITAKTRTQKCNFTLNGLQGKAIFGSIVGVVGAGKIGLGFIRTMIGMGAEVFVFDEFAQTNSPRMAQDVGFKWSGFNDLLAKADFISLHAPLLPSTKHMIDEKAIAMMKDGVILVNAARGGLVETKALVNGLKSGKIGGAGLDVLEREEGRFFFDKSNEASKICDEDKEWGALLKMDNVLITAHQAFFTTIALTQIAEITLANADAAQKGDFSKALKLQSDGKVLNG